jgi:hypothetical protein
MYGENGITGRAAFVKIPFVREWGSWVVFASSALAAIAAASVSMGKVAGSGSATDLIMVLVGMFFLINAKNPLASSIRSGFRHSEHVLWLMIFSLSGALLLLPPVKSAMPFLAVCVVPVATYVVLLRAGKEHHIMAELNGFALLALSAPVVFFIMTGNISWRIYLTVLLFFWAGVFKVRVRIRKNRFYKTVMVLYCIFAVAAYAAADIPVIILLPLIENAVSSLWFREQKLRTTGNIELAKSVLFVLLVWRFWP